MVGTSSEFRFLVRVPSIEEFGARYRQYRRRAEGDGRRFFDLVMRPDSFVAAAIVTEKLGLPGVAGIAGDCTALAGGKLEAVDKQFVGALVCSLMLANGYSKTGKKRAIPQPGWSKGEVYELLDSGSGLTSRPATTR
jgi:hypothetical protein